MLPDYYALLQVTPTADPEVIEAAYKRLAFKHHPDRNNDPSAGEMMKLLNDARDVLLDPARRRAYDLQRQRQERGSRGRQEEAANPARAEPHEGQGSPPGRRPQEDMGPRPTPTPGKVLVVGSATRLHPLVEEFLGFQIDGIGLVFSWSRWAFLGGYSNTQRAENRGWTVNWPGNGWTDGSLLEKDGCQVRISGRDNAQDRTVTITDQNGKFCGKLIDFVNAAKNNPSLHVQVDLSR